MLLNLNRSVSSSYSHLAIVFFVQAAILTIVRGVFHDIFKEDYLRYLGPTVAPIGVLFFIFIVRLIKNLGVSKGYVNFILALLVFSIGLRISSVLFISDYRISLVAVSISSLALLTMQVICVYFMCTNLFIEVNPIKEKLWASVCVYFMIGATFGTIYSVLFTINPMALGIELSKPVDIYIVGLFYSMNVISGLDPIYEHASETVQMTAVLESIFIVLFMVILIGRLLGSRD